VNAPIDPENSLSSLRPQIFLDGLLVDVRQYRDNTNVRSIFEEAVVGVRSYYIFSFIDLSGPEPELLEKIWIDRSDLKVGRKQVFGKDGKLETDVDYLDYPSNQAIAFPKNIAIHRPNEDLTVKMTFQQTDMNETLEAKVFDLPRPEGAELLQLTKAK
jgi:hypothetical protein